MGPVRHALSVLGLTSLALSAVACGGAFGGDRVQGAEAMRLALSPAQAKDIGAGYRTYGVVLARWGSWQKDGWYGVRWCPRVAADFVPYRSRGHWGAAGAAGTPPPVAPVPTGAPYWVSDDADTWGDITTHHGWWVHLDDEAGAAPPSGRGAWCWIPGAEATAGRVVWRQTDGVVGWAAEPPVWVDDGSGGAVVDGMVWTYLFLGALFEPDLDDQCFQGDAYEQAAAATMPQRPVRTAPRPADVAEARKELVAYADAHDKTRAPSTVANAAGGSGSAGGGSSSGASGGSSGGSSGTGSSSSSSSNPDKGVGDGALPKARTIYVVMMDDPMIGMGPPFLPRFFGHPVASSGDDSAVESASASSPSSPSSGSSASSPSSAGSGWSAPAAHSASSWSPSHASSSGHASSGSSASASTSSSSSSSHTSSMSSVSHMSTSSHTSAHR